MGKADSSVLPVPEPASRDLLALLLLLAAVGVGLTRFAGLDAWSLWIDEAFTLADATGDGRRKNPLGYAVFAIWLHVVDGRPDEFALRIVPAALGWIGIPLTYWAFRPYAGARAAALAALIVATSSWHQYWSQNARFYTLAQDVSLFGAGLALRGLFAGTPVRLVLGLVFAGVAGLAHPSAVFLAAALVIAPLGLRRCGLPGFGRGLGRGRTLGLAAIVGLLAGGGWAWDIWRNWDGGVKGVGTPALFLLSTGFFVTPLLGTAALVGALVSVARRDPFGLLAAAVTAIAIAGLLAASFFARANAQYVFYTLPWFAILAALPLRGMATPRERSLAAIVGALLVLAPLPRLMLYFTIHHGERPRWREAYQHVRAHREPDDLVVGMEGPVGEYYLDPRATELREMRSLLYLDEWRTGAIGDAYRRGRRTWFVVNFELFEDIPEEKGRSEVLEMLRRECRMDARFEVDMDARDLDVYVFVRD